MRIRRMQFNPDLAAPVAQLIASLHALTELHLDGDVEWVAGAFRAAPSLRQMTLNCSNCFAPNPGIREIMIECSAALTIEHCDESSIAMVCAGLDDTTSLTDLTLSLDVSWYDDAHTAVERNSTLVRFVGYFEPYRESNRTLPDLLAVYLQSLRQNPRLKFLSLRPNPTFFL